MNKSIGKTNHQLSGLAACENTIFRILDQQDGRYFVIDCLKPSMPQWRKLEKITYCTEDELRKHAGVEKHRDMAMQAEQADSGQQAGMEKQAGVEKQASQAEQTDIAADPENQELTPEQHRIAQARFTMISPVLACLTHRKDRDRMIADIARENSISKQTVRHYLYQYLIYQDVNSLAPKERQKEHALTEHQKNMRWALNKFFYTRNRNTLTEAYAFMIKEKYCDINGNILPDHPTIHQFRYFYRQYNKLQTYYISREGIKAYERDYRPLLGDGMQDFTPFVGTAMLDATICDIYLVNEGMQVVGRPIFTAAVDGFSSLCTGYSLQWEGGMYSVRNLMRCILADKVKWCRERGIAIEKDAWPSHRLPGVFVTDEGSEYKCETLAQITELGVRIINLPAYRPDLKGNVEKLFDLIQSSFKTYLKGHGVIMPDFQQRGAHDYRKDACLTMDEFEKIVIRCILYYNSQRIVENHPYTEAMLKAHVRPYAHIIYAWGTRRAGCNLISADEKTVMLALLPRTIGTFSRAGLTVNRMRYKAEGFTEQFLQGGKATVAYNPDNVAQVWLVEKGVYTPFTLIESRYMHHSVEEVDRMKQDQKDLVNAAEEEELQAKINLARYIETIRDQAVQSMISRKATSYNRYPTFFYLKDTLCHKPLYCTCSDQKKGDAGKLPLHQ